MNRGERGMVSVETAFAAIFLSAGAGFAIAVTGVLFTLGQCQVTANEVARQAARGDTAGIARATEDAPAGATVSRTVQADAVVVEVRVDAALGPLTWPVVAHARVLEES